jgi:hypothetical protein
LGSFCDPLITRQPAFGSLFPLVGESSFHLAFGPAPICGTKPTSFAFTVAGNVHSKTAPSQKRHKNKGVCTEPLGLEPEVVPD